MHAVGTQILIPLKHLEVAKQRLHPEIGRLAGWEDAATTLTDLYERRIRGNAVLTIP